MLGGDDTPVQKVLSLAISWGSPKKRGANIANSRPARVIGGPGMMGGGDKGSQLRNWPLLLPPVGTNGTVNYRLNMWEYVPVPPLSLPLNLGTCVPSAHRCRGGGRGTECGKPPEMQDV